jgi:DNA-binding response OmpR family regulator
MRIAVLDNDRSQADLICQVLTSAGHVCQSFDNGKDMLAQLRKDSVDMLILDWQVADLNGGPPRQGETNFQYADHVPDQ